MIRSIYGVTEEQLKQYFTDRNQKPFRSAQIFEWVYRHRIHHFREMTNIKKEVIEQLEKDFSLDRLTLVVHQQSKDETNKFLFRLQDGNLIETVLMKHDYGYSVCVTSQVGCNMGCAFCASGMRKKRRNLEPFEMVLQILTVSELIGVRISHVVVMGIGEPFDNYDNVLSFLQIINHPKGLEIGARHITVSTCGIVPKIYEYAEFGLQVNLAISLHAASDVLRSSLMKINRVYSLEDLKKAIRFYIQKTNRRVTLEYILLKDVNDSLTSARELADWIEDMNVYVNLIPYNEVKEKPFSRSETETMRRFFDYLCKRRINVTMRREQGFDIDAACGQLRSKHIS